MSNDPLIGQQLANFRLERVIGRGGMGQVYYSWDVKLQRPVAVKVVDVRFRNNPAYAKRFVREAQAVAQWRQENIAQVYYADEEGDLSYFAMEYVDGLDLGQLLSHYASRGELMPERDALRIGRAIASALDYAHAKKVVHRDVKPSNVIVARDERVVLTDFGLALDVEQGSVGEVAGTAHYIAPEQARRSSDATSKSDLYSLGIMLYEMLTGAVPFDDPSPTSVALQHITQAPPAPRTLNPNLTLETEAVLLKAISKSPNERYQTGAELIAALERALQVNQPAEAPAPLPPPPAGMRLPSQPARPSQMSAVEVIDSQVPSVIPSSAQTSQPLNRPAQKISPARLKLTQPRQAVLWLAAGGCVLFLVAAVVVASFLFANPLSNLIRPATQPADTLTAPTAIASSASTESTEVQSNEPVPGLTDTPLPSVIKYPNGKRFMLYYDEDSFYLLNLSNSVVPINWVAFERLSEDDTPLNRFDGSRWAEFYADSKPTWCMALMILESASHLDPAECDHDHLFLSVRTPTRKDPVVFWTTVEGSQQFRVLWREGGQDEEVARCEIGAGICEVFFP